MSDINKVRQSFEIWIKSEEPTNVPDDSYLELTSDESRYKNGYIQSYWICWQAAFYSAF